ncbi:MAG: protein kinase domain-containing protein [Phycisphaerales bacterium]
MTTVPPASIGPYTIQRELGRGGMGVVYLARDPKLDRDVAIKSLPALFAQEPARLERFQREAKVLASLNHPGIAAIHGLEIVDNQHYLVLEYVEGESLADRLARGPLPIDDALPLAKQIAEALEAAHEKGIVHRDLKPANLMLTPEGRVKVLDFGLARGGDTGVPSSTGLPYAAPDSPTLTTPARPINSPTIAGTIMGTAGYMSPEQARGKAVDKRSDIFSFGCVLYEMLSGAQPFGGETVTDALGATLHKDANLALLPPHTPPTIRLLLVRCLAKDRAHRLHDVADARVELAQAIADPNAWTLHGGGTAHGPDRGRTPRALLRRALPWAVSAALVAALAVVWFTAQPAATAVMRLTMTIPEAQSLASFPGSMMDISPDGTRVVFVGRTEAGRQLYLRALDQTEATPIANTESAFCPFFSPDGQWIAFGQNGKLRKVSILGGPATILANAPDLRGGTWGTSGIIAFSPDSQSGIWRVPAAGGEAVKATDAGIGEAIPTHRWPHFLPDGKTVLFTATDRNSEYTDATINVVSLDTGAQKAIIKGGAYARYVPTGHIVFGRSGTLMAVPFDAGRLEATGAAVPVLEGVLNGPNYGSVQFACADSGVMVYAPGSATEDDRLLVWLDASGKETPASGHKRGYFQARLSPDGTRVAAQITAGGNTDIWVLELERDSFTRLTFDEAVDHQPWWSPDGKWIVFSSNRGKSDFNLFRQPADGTGEAQRLTTSVNQQAPYGFTPDGSVLLYRERVPFSGNDILSLRLAQPESKPEVFLSTPFDESAATLSPDGKWLAYHSNESGTHEVYVRPFQRPGAKTKVSAGQSGWPRWSPDGKDLYYRSQQTMWAVSITPQDDGLRVSTPRTVFEVKGNTYNGPMSVSPDGARFLFIRSASETGEQGQQPTVIVNWLAELKAKMRASK